MSLRGSVGEAAGFTTMPPSTSEPNNLALTTWRTSGAITDTVHTEAELTPEDYLWETLPGRCCFSGRWDDVQDPPAWVSVDDHDRRS